MKVVELFFKKELEYYDGVLLFLAEDEAGAKYICTYLRNLPEYTEYLCARVTDNLHFMFQIQEIDLLDLIYESKNYFLLKTTKEEKPLITEPINLEEINPELLPDKDYYL